MFKRSLKRRDSSASLNKKHSRGLSSVAAPPGRTLIMSAGPSTSNSPATSLVSADAARHKRQSSYSGFYLEPTVEEPLDFAAEPLFNDSFLSPEPSDEFMDSFALPSTAQPQQLYSLSGSSYTHKFPALHEVEVDEDDVLSLEEYTSRVTSSIYGDNDLATAVYIARPVQKPRMVDVSPPASVTRRSSMAPSDASARDYTSASHSRTSSYFARNSYDRKSSFSNSSDSGECSDSGSDAALPVATPITPPSLLATPGIKETKDQVYEPEEATVISVARISHIRNLSASAPRELREKVTAVRLSEKHARNVSSTPSSPVVPRILRSTSAQMHRRYSSLDARLPPVPPLRRSSVVLQ